MLRLCVSVQRHQHLLLLLLPVALQLRPLLLLLLPVALLQRPHATCNMLSWAHA